MAVKSGDAPINEHERLTLWRFEALMELGLDPEQAISLVEIPDIVHAAKELVERGCPLEMISSLLED